MKNKKDGRSSRQNRVVKGWQVLCPAGSEGDRPTFQQGRRTAAVLFEGEGAPD